MLSSLKPKFKEGAIKYKNPMIKKLAKNEDHRNAVLDEITFDQLEIVRVRFFQDLVGYCNYLVVNCLLHLLQRKFLLGLVSVKFHFLNT